MDYDIDEIFFTSSDSSSEEEECTHEDYIVEKGERICNRCSKLIQHVTFDKDWRYYGPADTRNGSDPARCHKKRDNLPNVNNLLNDKNFSNSIKASINKKYQAIIKHMTEKNGKTAIYRGKNRTAVVGACTYFSFMDEGDCISLEEIVRVFDIKKKKLTKGIEIFKEVHPEYMKKYIEPHNLVRKHLISIDMHTQDHHEKVVKLCKYFYNRCGAMNSSYPNSIAAAILYLYIITELKGTFKISRSEYAKKVNLSEATISTLVKNAMKVIN